MQTRRAFSLVEIIISIFLLGIIVIFLYSTVSNLKKTNDIFEKNQKNLDFSEKIIDILYQDIFQADDLNASGREFTLLNLHTKNSIFHINEPYVSWVVTREDNTLLRFESIIPFSQLNSDNNNYIHISEVTKNCERFKIYQSIKKDKILIDIKIKDHPPIIYEFYKPFDIKPIKKDKNSTHHPTNHPK